LAFLDLAFLVTSLDQPNLRSPLGPNGLPVSGIYPSSQEDLEVKQTLKVFSSSYPSFLGQCSLD